MTHKNLIVPVFNQKATDGSRVVTGVAACFGNIDKVKDVVQPGAFRKSIEAFKAGRGRARFLWQHDMSQPPIAKILDIKEVGRDQLPAAVLAKDPTVQGGLVVKRQYFKDSFSDRVYQSIMSGSLDEMSFAYSTIKSSEQTINGQQVQLLEELELLDCSDVLWGCNPATVSAGAKGRHHSRRSIRPVLPPSQQAKLATLQHFSRRISPDGVLHDYDYQKFQIQSLKLVGLQLRAEANSDPVMKLADLQRRAKAILAR